MDKLSDCFLADSWLNSLTLAASDALYWEIPKFSLFALIAGVLVLTFPAFCLCAAVSLAFVLHHQIIKAASFFLFQRPTVSAYQQLRNTKTIDFTSYAVRWLKFWIFREERRLGFGFFLHPSHFVLAIVTVFILVFGFNEIFCVSVIATMIINGPAGNQVGKITLSCWNALIISVLLGEHFSITKRMQGIDEFEWCETATLKWNVQICENQRWWAGIGWSAELLRDDPRSWSNTMGNLGLRDPHIYRGIVNWNVSDWIYGSSFSSLQSSEESSGCCVRRRIWTATYNIDMNQISLADLAKSLRSTALAVCT
jgi:hypothetical protein